MSIDVNALQLLRETGHSPGLRPCNPTFKTCTPQQTWA